MTLELVLLITILLLLWNLIVVHFLAKWVYDFVKRYRDNVPADYVGRKVIHVFGAGFTALLIPIFFDGFYGLAVFCSFGLGLYLFFWRHYNLMYWFQVKENMYEVHFTLAYGLILLTGVTLENLLIGLVPMLFMSFGDSATGLIRAFTQKKQRKSWDGSLAMLIICAIIGWNFLGSYGLFVAAIATLIEKIPRIDDNVTVPLITALLVYLHGIII